jgi:hypothetical protein
MPGNFMLAGADPNALNMMSKGGNGGMRPQALQVLRLVDRLGRRGDPAIAVVVHLLNAQRPALRSGHIRPTAIQPFQTVS